MKRLVIALMATVIAFTASAQQRIRGTVRDAEGNPIANVLVRAEGSGISAVTDAEGYYRMPLVKGRNVTYWFTCEGYESRKLTLTGETAGEINTVLNRVWKAESSLYVVDGRIATKAEVDALKPESIANMDILHNIQSAVIVRTREVNQAEKSQVSTPADQQAVPFRVVVNQDTERVLVVIRNLDGTFRVGLPEILKEINPQVIRSLAVLKEKEAEQAIREHGQNLDFTPDAVIWVELGRPVVKTYKAKIAE